MSMRTEEPDSVSETTMLMRCLNVLDMQNMFFITTRENGIRS